MHNHLSTVEIEANYLRLGRSPVDHGRVEMVVARPAEGERIVLESAHLDTEMGLIGDNWQIRGSRHTADGSALLAAQITLMNSRVLAALAPDRERWQLAGDQLIVDLDLRDENLSAGQRLQIGSLILEITAQPHTGCAKFTERFGASAIRWVNSKEGRREHRRGIYARVIQAGTLAVGDSIIKVASTDTHLSPESANVSI